MHCIMPVGCFCRPMVKEHGFSEAPNKSQNAGTYADRAAVLAISGASTSSLSSCLTTCSRAASCHTEADMPTMTSAAPGIVSSAESAPAGSHTAPAQQTSAQPKRSQQGMSQQQNPQVSVTQTITSSSYAHAAPNPAAASVADLCQSQYVLVQREHLDASSLISPPSSAAAAAASSSARPQQRHTARAVAHHQDKSAAATVIVSADCISPPPPALSNVTDSTTPTAAAPATRKKRGKQSKSSKSSQQQQQPQVSIHMEASLATSAAGASLHPALKAHLQGTLGVAFSGGGFRYAYFIGVAQVLQELGILYPTIPVAGASSGALSAVFVKLGFQMDYVMESTKEFALDCRVNGVKGRLGLALRAYLLKYLPQDAHVLCHDSTFLAVTRGMMQRHVCAAVNNILYLQFSKRGLSMWAHLHHAIRARSQTVCALLARRTCSQLSHVLFSPYSPPGWHTTTCSTAGAVAMPMADQLSCFSYTLLQHPPTTLYTVFLNVPECSLAHHQDQAVQHLQHT